jgi:hypothetical protein
MPVALQDCGSRGLDCPFRLANWRGWFKGGCATKRDDDMEERSTISTPIASAREAMNRWAVAPGGCKPGVKELALKGPLRCDAGHQDGRAWLRGRRVSPPEADGNRREKTPLPQHPARWGSERTRKDFSPGRVATPDSRRGWLRQVTWFTLSPFGIPQSAGEVDWEPPPTRPCRGHRRERGRPICGAEQSSDEPYGRRRPHSTQRLGKPATGGRGPGD